MLYQKLLLHFKKYLELIIWTTGLLALFFLNPNGDDHYSLCIFKMIGFSKCPGCGLGHSINFLFHGRVKDSIAAHPLGIFALAILLNRIIQLSNKSFLSPNLKNVI